MIGRLGFGTAEVEGGAGGLESSGSIHDTVVLGARAAGCAWTLAVDPGTRGCIDLPRRG